MLKNIDTSVLDESTGLKLLKYLSRNDNSKGPGGTLRSRRELFQLKSIENTDDDFSIRQVKEKENTIVQKAAPPSPKTSIVPREDRSSLFKPNCMSTPLVPTTVHTPYRTSKKSRGTQKSPSLPPIPLSQEPEVPETPDVVPASQPARRTIAEPEQTPVVVAEPVATRTTPERIYPELENVVQQQNGLPIVIFATPRKSVAPEPESATVTQVTVKQIGENTPRVAPEAPPQPTPVANLPQTPIVAPPPQFASEDVTTPVIKRRAPLPDVPVESLMDIIRRASTTTVPEAVVSPQRAHVAGTPRKTDQFVQTPRSTRSERTIHSPRRAEGPVQTHHAEVHPEPAESPMKASPDAEMTQDLDDSSFVDVPTPQLKNFKLIMNDCRGSAKRRAAATGAPPMIKSPPKGPPKVPPAERKTKLRRASELTIPNDDRRSSLVTASASRRKLHSTVRELTPVSSPVAQMFERDYDESIQQQRTQEPSKRGRRSKKDAAIADEDSVVKKPSADNTRGRRRTTIIHSPVREEIATVSPPPKKRSTACPKSKKKVVVEPQPEEEPSQVFSDPPTIVEVEDVVMLPPPPPPPPTSRSLTTTPRSESSSGTKKDEDVFKKPALPAPRRKKTSVVPSFLDESESTRRSSRSARPVAPIVPYSVLQKPPPREKSVSHSKSQYSVSFRDFCKVFDKQDKKRAVTSDKSRAQSILKSVENHQREETVSSVSDAGNVTEAKLRRKPAATTKPQAEEVPKKPRTKAAAATVSQGEENRKRGRPRKNASTAAQSEEKPGKTRKKRNQASAEEAFDALKAQDKEVMEEEEEDDEFPPPMDVVPEEPETEEEAMQVAVETPKKIPEKRKYTRNPSRGSKRAQPAVGTSGNCSENTYRDNFSQNNPPSSSTNVDSFERWSTATVSRTMRIDSFVGVTEDKVRRMEFDGGIMMTYPDYAKGTFVLHSKKSRARVKGKPLTLNVLLGSVLVNLESEQRVARLSQFDEISIPVGMWYSIENVHEPESAIMFTWK